jgi:hypothetical protein
VIANTKSAICVRPLDLSGALRLRDAATTLSAPTGTLSTNFHSLILGGQLGLVGTNFVHLLFAGLKRPVQGPQDIGVLS